VAVDAAQLVGALPVAGDLPHVDVLAVPDHKFLLNAGRGMGDCYLSPRVQERFVPINAGWRAGAIPFDSVPLGEVDPARVVTALSERGIIASARDGNLRLSIHVYNHEDDIERLTTVLGALSR
jgi:selenocysteine lyase/cysteine desulfurase